MNITKVLIEKPGYQKWSASKISKHFGVSLSQAIAGLNKAKETKENTVNKKVFTIKEEDKDYQEFLKYKQKKDNLLKQIAKPSLIPYLKGNPDNVLVIGDLHEPFCLDGYMQFCREQQEKFNCGTIVFIGDIIDNHYSSYHESELDTYGPNTELDIAKAKIKNWYTLFPNAYVCIGNHDRIVSRKAKTAGISDRWIRGYSEVLGTPGWKFVTEIVLNNVCYNHGEGGEAEKRMLVELMSQVQGHLHAKFYIKYGVGARHKIFGVQVGCGIDRNAFAFAYGKHGPKPIIGCSVVLNKGTLPILLPMDL